MNYILDPYSETPLATDMSRRSFLQATVLFPAVMHLEAIGINTRDDMPFFSDGTDFADIISSRWTY